MSRTSQSIKNIAMGIGSQLVLSAIAFFTTRLIKINLGLDYLGLSGIFGNIISFLSLSELGIGSAIVFALYKPLAENNKSLIFAIMQFYKKAYRIVAASIFGLGLVIMFFLPAFVKTVLPMNYVRFVFILFLINSSSSYLLSYKRNLIYADQKNYIISLYSLFFSAMSKVGQLAIFILTNSYVLYLSVDILCTVALNISLSHKADKLYPYLKEKRVENLPAETKEMLTTKIKAMFFHSIGGFCVHGTDNILISFFEGLAIVGIYGSYTKLIALINTIIQNISTGMISSVGNFLVGESIDKKYELFEKIEFVYTVIAIFISTCLAVLFNPFVAWWLGEDAVLPKHIMYLISFNVFLELMRNPPGIVRNAAGLFEQDKYAPIIESFLNLVVSILLARRIGLAGIILGTTISTLAVPIWVPVTVIYKNIFLRSSWRYFSHVIRNLICVVAITYVCEIVIKNIFIYNKTMTLLVCFAITIAITMCAIILILGRDKNFKFFKNMVTCFVRRKI